MARAYSNPQELVDAYTGYGGYSVQNRSVAQHRGYIDIRNALAGAFSMPLLTGAEWSVEATANPSEDDTFTITDGRSAVVEVFTYKAAPATTHEVAVGTDAAASLLNLVRALQVYSQFLTGSVSGVIAALGSRKLGSAGNDLTLAESAANFDISQTVLGVGDYPLLTEINNQFAAGYLIQGGNASPLDTGGVSMEYAQAQIDAAQEKLDRLLSGKLSLLDTDTDETLVADTSPECSKYEEAMDWND